MFIYIYVYSANLCDCEIYLSLSGYCSDLTRWEDRRALDSWIVRGESGSGREMLMSPDDGGRSDNPFLVIGDTRPCRVVERPCARI